MTTLTNEQILDIAERVGFEYNDFGRWNCSSDDICELIARIEEQIKNTWKVTYYDEYDE
jgi:hypothetical protein